MYFHILTLCRKKLKLYFLDFLNAHKDPRKNILDFIIGLVRVIGAKFYVLFGFCNPGVEVSPGNFICSMN